MQFEFHGEKYRIQFHHQKSKRWSDHEGHHVCLTRLNGHGKVTLHCTVCEIAIGNIPQRDWQRMTRCIIQIWSAEQSQWIVFSQAWGRPNMDAGDNFNRADGRHAALTNVLRQVRTRMRELTPDFMDAAWVAYDVRTAPKVRIHVG